MKSSIHLIRGSVALLLLAVAGNASPIVWTLNDVALSDGATASGTFTFDPDAGALCGSFSPCGKYTGVDIVTTSGASRPAATYSFVCGQDVAACTGVTPDSTEVLFLASNASNQTGNPAIAFFFTAVGVFPPQGLTDAGGSVDISGATAGIVNEGSCSNASCATPSNPQRSSVSGTVTAPSQPVSVSAVPEPATWLLLTAGFAVMALLRLRSAAARQPR